MKRRSITSTQIILLVVLLTFMSTALSPERYVEVPESRWSDLTSMNDIARIEWDLEFEVDAAPMEDYRFIASSSSSIQDGIHVTIDLYGNGFLVMGDERRDLLYQIVHLAHPMIGRFRLSMKYRTLGSDVPIRHLEIELNDHPIAIYSGDPGRQLNIGDLRLVPKFRQGPIPEGKLRAGRVLANELKVFRWKR